VRRVEFAPEFGGVSRQSHRICGEQLGDRGSAPFRIGRELIDRIPNDGGHRHAPTLCFTTQLPISRFVKHELHSAV
jgi:hypothetical protein